MNHKYKAFLITAAKVLLFLALFLSLYGYTREVLRDKTQSEALAIVMDQPKGSYDVVFAGPSHMQYAMHPAQLFAEYGITSCNVSTSAQSIPTSYYVVKELIRQQEPELVVLDLFCLFYPEIYFTPVRFHQAVDNFSLSSVKAEAIEDLGGDFKKEFYLNYLLYHGRWKELTRYDYTIHREFNETFQLLYGATPYPTPFAPVDPGETAEIPEVPLTYLKKLVELCRETDTRLLLTVIPYRADEDNNDTSAIYQQQLYNALALHCQEWGVDYLNGLHYLQDMAFDFNTDMYEYSHVNTSGAQKISNWYGRYLQDHYDLTDHRSNPDFSHWYEDVAAYQQALLGAERDS